MDGDPLSFWRHHATASACAAWRLSDDRTLKGANVGMTYANVVVRNPGDREQEWRGRFLVDTGAVDSLVPRPWLESIGLKPLGTQVYELADGTEVTFDLAVAEFEIMGKTVGATVVFGEPRADPLLGATVLESACLHVDPFNGELKRLPSSRL